MAALPEVALPVTLTSAKVEALLEADVTAGCRLTSVTDKVGGAKVYNTSDSVPNIQGGTRGLWEIVGYIDDDRKETLTPADSTDFVSYGPVVIGGDDFYILEWHGITASNGARLWCRLGVGIRAGADQVEWYGWCGRENQIDFLLYDFFYPRITLKGPSSTRGGDANHFDAQGRTRICVPMAVNTTFPYFFQNQPINAFAETLEVELFGPRFMQMPFVTVCSGNDRGGVEYRKNFALRVQRDRPYMWTFRSHGTTANGGADQYTELAFSTIASAVKDMGNRTHAADGLAAPAYHTNTYGPKHAHLIELFTSPTDEFWWDICIRHREDYRAATSAVKLRSNPALSPIAKQVSQVCSVWVIQQSDANQKVAMANYAEYARIINAMFGGHLYLDRTKFLFHQQVHQRNFSGGVIGEEVANQPEYQRDNVEFMKGSEAAWMQIDAIQGRRSCYINPLPWVWPTVFRDPPRNYIRPFDGKADRTASPTTSGDIFGAAYYDRWVKSIGVGLVGAANSSGAVHDLWSGTSFTVYQEGAGEERDHIGGGGAWCGEAKQLQLDQFRSECAAVSQRATATTPDADFPVLSEIAEEFIDVDLTGPGYFWQPAHFMGGKLEATMTLDSDGNPFWVPQAVKADYPAGFQQMQPFLWRAVHHEWDANFNFSTNLTTQPLATEQAPDPGMSPEEWRDFTLMHRALVHVTGGQNFLHTIYLDADTYFPIVDERLNTRDAAIVAQSYVDEVVGFCQTLMNLGAPAYAQWMIDGIYERDISIDFTLPGLTWVNNPAAAARKMAGWAAGLKVSPDGNWPFYSEITRNWRFGNKDFHVLAVLHSVWRERSTGRVGVIFINWTNKVADWVGNIDIGLYGLGVTATISRIDPDGTKVPIGVSITQRFDIVSAAAPPGAGVYLGHLAAHSVMVIEIESP